ncbi:uncharacterized protein AB9X84_007800 [Acanthopagrus schlegelii]
MLLKAQHGRTKKYVKLEEVSFSDFINAVQQKFIIPKDKVLKVTDEQGIEVDDDVFPELATESLCFVISIDDVIPLAESSKNMAECSDPTEFADCSNLTEFVTLDLTLLQQGSGANSHF